MQVFISWASPNKTVVEQLVKRLAATGLKCWFSDREMNAGDEPVERVLKEIRNSGAAIILLSDEAIQRPWMCREIDWCVAEGFPIFTAVVGPLTPGNVPELIRDKHRQDLTGAVLEAGLPKLISAIKINLRIPDPIVVPAAMFTMTLDQYDKLVRDDVAWHSIRALCQNTGISDTQFDGLLRSRYGKTALDFAPFKDGVSILDMVLDAQYRTNSERLTKGGRPIVMKWCHDDLMTKPVAGLTLDEWSKDSSLLIIDSVSICHPLIKESLRELPGPRKPTQSSVLWVPPYTRYTAMIQMLIETAANEIPFTRDAFRWFLQREMPELWTAFDITIPASFSDWVYRVVSAQNGQPSPYRAAVNAMELAVPSMMRPDFFNRQPIQ